MAFSDILCPVLSLGADEPALAAAEVVAERGNARITALMVEVEPDPISAIEGATERRVLADALAQMHTEFEAEKRKLEARTRGPREIEVRELTVSRSRAGSALGAEARQADLHNYDTPGRRPA